ncbi:flavone 3'-O-methyltransferase 1 [Cryptomeria japonica]|uniref:flavone 3'-O-methyltransferase 1 n=1 Tax=Cryptomeria japonica TaxID=3369 RepID=UPI0025ABC4F7|nr:flavone 3'-O-methyltransferase 1 [Cryptomeria japonica]
MDNTPSLSPRIAIIELCAMCSVPMSLKAALNLNVFDIMAKASKPMSAQEIVKEMPQSKSPNYENLSRIMRLLTSYHVFEEHVDQSMENPAKYELTAVGKALVRREDGCSLGSLIHLNQDKVLMDAWQFLHEAVTDGDVEPFVKCHGKSPQELALENPGVQPKIYMESMAASTMLFMEDLLASSYNGFEGINVLVDIGGGIGKALSMIVAKYPSITGINFDLPYVIQHAPSFPGIKHEMGSMFDSIPSGDAMFLKRVLHNWNDDQCIKILRNCYEKLAKKGKVIVLDCVLPSKTNANADCRAALELDLHMMALNAGAKERSLHDFKMIAEAAGFKSVKLVYQLDVLLSVIEIYN